MTDKTELLANIETSKRERDQISRLADILLKRLVLKKGHLLLLSLFLFLFSFLLLLSLCLSIALFDIVVNERLVIGSRKEKIIKKIWMLAT